MRLIAVVFGVLITLAGIVWGLQGLGVIPGSFMSNNPSWIWIGGGAAPLRAPPLGRGAPLGPPPPNPPPPPPPAHPQRAGINTPPGTCGRRRPGSPLWGA